MTRSELVGHRAFPVPPSQQSEAGPAVTPSASIGQPPPNSVEEPAFAPSQRRDGPVTALSGAPTAGCRAQPARPTGRYHRPRKRGRVPQRCTHCGCWCRFIGLKGHHAAADGSSEFSTAGCPDDYITAFDGEVPRNRSNHLVGVSVAGHGALTMGDVITGRLTAKARGSWRWQSPGELALCEPP